MKKKNVKLGKLNLAKSSVASLGQTLSAKGGTQGPTIFDYGCGTVGPNCSIPCGTVRNCPDPNPGGSWPACQPTQGFTCGPVCNVTEDCGTNQTCDPGGFLCDAGFGGGLA